MEGLRLKYMLKRIALSNWFVTIALISTFALVFLLAYIDEGYYNFKWMQEPGAWFVFFIYWNIFFWPIIGLGFLIKYIKNK